MGMILYVVISLLLIGVLSYMLVRCKKTEPFSTCTPMAEKRHVDTNMARKLYSSGKLTEYTERKKQCSGWQEMPWEQFLRSQH